MIKCKILETSDEWKLIRISFISFSAFKQAFALALTQIQFQFLFTLFFAILLFVDKFPTKNELCLLFLTPADFLLLSEF